MDSGPRAPPCLFEEPRDGADDLVHVTRLADVAGRLDRLRHAVELGGGPIREQHDRTGDAVLDRDLGELVAAQRRHGDVEQRQIRLLPAQQVGKAERRAGVDDLVALGLERLTHQLANQIAVVEQHDFFALAAQGDGDGLVTISLGYMMKQPSTTSLVLPKLPWNTPSISVLVS